MNVLKMSVLSLAMIFVGTASLSAELCQKSGCASEAQESVVKYCLEHGCPKSRSPEKLCSLPVGHDGVCTMVKRPGK